MGRGDGRGEGEREKRTVDRIGDERERGEGCVLLNQGLVTPLVTTCLGKLGYAMESDNL